MVSPKRIDLSLLDDDLKTMINASAKIFPVAYSYVTAGTNPNNYDYVRIADATLHKNEVYIWNSAWELIGADDKSIDWMEVSNRPDTFPPSTHSHTIADVSGLQTTLDGKVNTVAGKGLSTLDYTTADKNKLDSLSDTASVDYNTMLDNLNAHKDDTTIHVTAADKTTWNTVTGKVDKTYVDNGLAGKADASTLSGHTGNATIHVTQADKDAWNAKQSALGFTPENTANKGVSSGYASLGTDGKVPSSQLPALGGSGDMMRSTYDPDGDGKVSSAVNADAVPWSGVSGRPAVETHIADTTVHVTASDKTTWDTVTGKADKSYVDTGLAGKADSSTLSGHTGNTTIHVTQTDKDSWNGKLSSLIPSGQGIKFDTDGAAFGRLFTLTGVPNWVGWTLNAEYSASGWNLDDTSVPGWFLKLDIRATLVEFALYKIPAGANPHTNEYPVFKVNGADDEAYVKTNKVYHAGNLMTVGNVQPTTDLWYKVVG